MHKNFLIIVFKRKIKKNLLKLNKIPTIMFLKKKNILLEINNNSYYYNFLKKNQVIVIILINKKFNVKIININYHPYKKYILNIDLINIS